MTNSADPDQLASEEANWSGSTLFARTGHVVFSKEKDLESSYFLWRQALVGFILIMSVPWLSWKLGQGYQNLTKDENHPSYIIYQVWPASINWLRRKGIEALFYCNEIFIFIQGSHIKDRIKFPDISLTFPWSKCDFPWWCWNWKS